MVLQEGVQVGAGHMLGLRGGACAGCAGAARVEQRLILWSVNTRKDIVPSEENQRK